MRPEIRDILIAAKSPFRYIGGEVGSRNKPWNDAEVRLCLAFPDVYEIGMSHMGMAILYQILNDEPGMLADRAFAPWGDVEAELTRRGMPLFALESERPLCEFDIIGFSLAYELTYTNVLNMLQLSGIPIRSSERLKASGRGEAMPLIIAGGPCAFNPMPMAPFLDAIVIGDGEEAVLKIARAVAWRKREGAPPSSLLERLAAIRGIYVPAIHGMGDGGAAGGRPGTAAPVGKAFIPDLGAAPFPTRPLVPHRATHERVAVEASRGCGRGCRFCQAGFIYRPVRQREGPAAAELACEALVASGAEEFGFLALSLSDWAPLEETLAGVHSRAGGMPVGASLPSLRAEALSDGIMAGMGSARAGSFTLAPEAGTERMRRLINKGNSDSDLYASIGRIFGGGWHAVKLYFMVGLPGENKEDMDGIVSIANHCLDIGRRHHRRPDVTVATSTFVPKAHTPFQWERQIQADEALAIQREFKRKLRRPGLHYRWHDAHMSAIEGVLSRGGAELARAIEIAHRKGARFDGWEEHFDPALWREAFSEAGISPGSYLEARDPAAPLPWDDLKVGPEREFLLRERERAYSLMETEDCTRGRCSACGICDFSDIKNRTAESSEEGEGSETSGKGEKAPNVATGSLRCYRLRYRKAGRAAFLGHIEALDALKRGLRAAELPLAYSAGFHPRPRVSVGPALPLGIESEAEFIDVELTAECDPGDIVRKLAGRLPDGMEAIEAWLLKPGAPSIEQAIALWTYDVGQIAPDAELISVTQGFERSPRDASQAGSGSDPGALDPLGQIALLAYRGEGVLRVSILNRPPLLKVRDALARLLGREADALRDARIRKVGVEWRTNS